MKTISKKTVWVATDGWRGYSKPINAVCGANDTGTYSDSPCNSNTRKAEIGKAKKVLKQNHIRFNTMWTQSSNVFCQKQYILVMPEDKERAIELIRPLIDETHLLYLCN